MVARPGLYSASNNAGELKPELHGRTDIKQFYAGLAYALNIEPVPQGGSRLSPRSRHIARARNILAELVQDSATLAAGPHTVGAVLIDVTFADEQDVSVVTIPDCAATQSLGAILQVEYDDGAAWQAFGAPFTMSTRVATRTVALAPGTSKTTTGIRLRMISAPPSSTTFTISGLSAFEETATLPAVAIVRPFTFSLDQTYEVVLAAGHADFFRDGVFVGGCPNGLSDDQISSVDIQQRFDTMLLFHEDLEPARIFRNGADNEWLFDRAPFENVPKVNLGGTYAVVTDKWQVWLRFPTSGTYVNGQLLYVSLNIDGEETAAVYTGTPVNWTAFIAALKTAIEDLPGVDSGVTVTQINSGSGFVTLEISFAGENNGRQFSVTAQVTNTGEAAATVTHTQIGQLGGEALMSETRGWPSCANFYQDRLIPSGFKAKKGAILASVTGEYFDTNIEIASAVGAILANLDTDGAEQIHKLARARHLVIFTTDAEYFVSDRVLNRTATPNIVNCSRNGSKPGVPIVETEGALIYVSRNGAVIYAATYDDVSQAYLSSPISLLASHIASNVIDQALQKASDATDAARLWCVRSDGTMTLGIVLRNQDVTGFVRWHTDGEIKSVCVNGQNDASILVKRPVGDGYELHLEALELGLIFDGTIEQTFGAATATITGLARHEGRQVWAQADGDVVGPFTVASGQIELPFEASLVSVGRWTPLRAITLPLPSEVAERTVVKRPRRVHTVRVDLVDTTSLAIAANNRPATDVALNRAGDDASTPIAPVNRTEAVSGLVGFSDTGQVEITQVRPGLLAWRGVTIEAR